MSANKREPNRVSLVIDIKLTCNDQSEYIFKSHNISDTGVFLEHNDKRLDLSPGTQVILQVCSPLDDEPAPPVKAEIVRVTKEGIGLQFIL